MNFFIRRFISPKKSGSKNIAIIMPTQNGVIEQVRSGIVSTLTSYGIDFEHDLIFGSDDITKSHQKINAALQNEQYDLVFSIGKSTTQTVKKITTLQRLYTPIIFNGVIDPVKAGLVYSEAFSGNHLTGLSAHKRDYIHQMKILLALHAPIKNALILYSSIEINNTQEEVEQMLNFLKISNIRTTEIMLTSQNDFSREISPYLPFSDIIIILRDQPLILRISELVEICKPFRVPIYTSDFESIKNGATFGYSDYDYNIGVETAKKSLSILLEGKSPQEVPINMMPWKGKLMINGKTSTSSSINLNGITQLSTPEEIIII